MLPGVGSRRSDWRLAIFPSPFCTWGSSLPPALEGSCPSIPRPPGPLLPSSCVAWGGVGGEPGFSESDSQVPSSFGGVIPPFPHVWSHYMDYLRDHRCPCRAHDRPLLPSSAGRLRRAQEGLVQGSGGFRVRSAWNSKARLQPSALCSPDLQVGPPGSGLPRTQGCMAEHWAWSPCRPFMRLP